MGNAKPGNEAAAVWVDVKTLTPWVDNPRKNDHAVMRVADSIKRFGFSSPIIARKENGEIIAGHTRLKAALALGLDKVPVRYLDLDPADAHLLALADNKLGELADWDDAMVAEVLAGYDADDCALAGFEELPVGVEDIDAAFGSLPDGDKEPFQQITFTLHDSQAELVNECIARAAKTAPADVNKNKNGNALALICAEWANG